MKETKEDLIKYRLLRAKDTFEDAQILAERHKWNSTINRLYYSAYVFVQYELKSAQNDPKYNCYYKSNLLQ